MIDSLGFEIILSSSFPEVCLSGCENFRISDSSVKGLCFPTTVMSVGVWRVDLCVYFWLKTPVLNSNRGFWNTLV